ncbi:MAG: hypothetical protein KDB03_16370 [Planctomycetales bacterium]|nr:hypothetical protein [Planctomycetales bacterium]
MSLSSNLTNKILEAVEAVFGEAPVSHQVHNACQRYQKDLENIQSGRGIGALLIAIVGAKGQGKTWVARQFVRDERTQAAMRSGDLSADATTRLVWVGPVAPEGLDRQVESYFPCQPASMLALNQPFVILDTPGVTDADARAAELATESLTLAPIKLLVIARDQIRAATNIQIARRIDGSVCIPIVTSVDPDELPGASQYSKLADDLRSLRDQLQILAPQAIISPDVLVPDFEITGDESQSSRTFIATIMDRLNEVSLSELAMGNSRDTRVQVAQERLRREVAQLIRVELPHLRQAVEQLNRETEHLPEHILASLLGSNAVLETGIRLRLRARLVSDAALIWFPYRTVMATLNLTQGAWDRVVLAMTGSVPSLFGALSSWARNARQSKEFSLEMQNGIRNRSQKIVEERLQPLVRQFQQAVMKLRPREQRLTIEQKSELMMLSGIEELQLQSQEIFDRTLDEHASRRWLAQFWGLGGVLVFWMFMAGPIVLLYREYFHASLGVFTGADEHLEDFPHPTPGLFLTSLILSLLPLLIYCMLVLTLSLPKRKISRVAKQILNEHEQAIAELKSSAVIRLVFDDSLLAQAEYLLNLDRKRVADGSH